MVSPLEFCPKCQRSCSTILSIGLRKTVRLDSDDSTEIIFHVHCRSCNAYIRSFPMVAETEEPAIIELTQYAFNAIEQSIPA